MARYCIYCGRSLEENETCNCTLKQSTTFNQQSNFNQQQNNFEQHQDGFTQQQTAYHQPAPKHPPKLLIAIKNVIPFLKAYFKSPISAMKAAIQNTDFPLVLIFAALYCISIGTFAITCIHHAYTFVNSILQQMNLLGISLGGVRIHSLPVFLLFFTSGLIILGFTVLLFLLSTKFVHSDLKSSQIIVAGLTTFIYPTICIILAIIVSYIYFPLALCFMALNYLFHTIMLFITLKAILNGHDNSTFTCSIVLAIFITQLVTGFVVTRFTLGLTPDDCNL